MPAKSKKRPAPDGDSPSKHTRTAGAARVAPAPAPSRPTPVPRRQAAVVTAERETVPKPGRARRVCRRCNGPVLVYLDECPVHSKAGKAKSLESESARLLETEPAPFVPATAGPPQTWEPPTAGPPQTWEVPLPSSTPLPPSSPPIGSQYSSPPELASTPTRPRSAPSGSSHYLLQRAGGTSVPPSPLRQSHFPPVATAGPIPIDPALCPTNVAQTPPSLQARAFSSEPELQLHTETSPLPGPSESKKPRRSAQPGEFGYVSNVRDGKRVYNLVRKHKPPHVASNRDMGTRTFKRRVKTILESCEDVSISTGACIFFGAYHPTQKTDKIWTYTSPKIVSKAPSFTKDTLKGFYNTMKALGDAKRVELQELQEKLDASEERTKALEDELARYKAQSAGNQDNAGDSGAAAPATSSENQAVAVSPSDESHSE